MAKINKEAQAAMPQKLIKELFEYNELTGGWVWIKKPSKHANNLVGQPAGTVNKVSGYVTIQINGYPYKAHRLAWTYVHGDYPDGVQPYIDHVNGKKADNRIANLRVNSLGENNRNHGMQSNNTSGVTGVHRTSVWNGNKNKLNWYWMAHWYNEKGKHCKKKFNIEKLGEEEAKQLAIRHRAEQIRLLELNHGIIYSDRHGK